MYHNVETPRVGEVYSFKGLSGEVDEGRVMTIFGISVSGKVDFKLELEGFEPNIHSVPLTELLEMIGRGIWVKED